MMCWHAKQVLLSCLSDYYTIIVIADTVHTIDHSWYYWPVSIECGMFLSIIIHNYLCTSLLAIGKYINDYINHYKDWCFSVEFSILYYYASLKIGFIWLCYWSRKIYCPTEERDTTCQRPKSCNRYP